MSSKIQIFLLITLIFNIFSYVQSSRQIQLILKFDEAINLSTSKFLTPQCDTETNIQQTLNQLDEWVQITQNIDSLKQYKQSLVELVDMIEESRFYVEEVEKQQDLNDQSAQENKAISLDDVQKVSEIQLANANIELTLDELTERLSRIENIQNYLQTLREEGFKDYEDYGKVLGSLSSFIQDIDNLEQMEDQLSINRFKLIEKADAMQQIYNSCYGETNANNIQQESDNSDIFKFPQSEQTIHPKKKHSEKINKKTPDQSIDHSQLAKLIKVQEGKDKIKKEELSIQNEEVNNQIYKEEQQQINKEINDDDNLSQEENNINIQSTLSNIFDEDLIQERMYGKISSIDQEQLKIDSYNLDQQDALVANKEGIQDQQAKDKDASQTYGEQILIQTNQNENQKKKLHKQKYGKQ